MNAIPTVSGDLYDGMSARLTRVRAVPDAAASTEDASISKAGESGGIKVDFSPLARMLSMRQGTGEKGAIDNSDIEESNLPGTTKEVLKQIRELNERLRELQQQVASVQSDDSLSADQKQAKIQQLQGQIQTITGALATANSSLQKLMKDQNLSKEQQASVATMLAK